MPLSGRNQVVFIQGEAGSGKSAVMTEFARRAERGDPKLLIAGGRCHPATGACDLYARFRRALRVLLGDLHDALATGIHAPDQARRLWAGSSDSLEVLFSTGQM
jgi:predicted ATPase